MMDIPVLDWSRFTEEDRQGFVSDLAAACRGPGFFLLSGHGVPQTVIDSVFSQADRFFSQSEVQKRSLAIDHTNRGWAQLGSENLDDSQPGQRDHKEAFNIGLEMAADDPRVLANEPFRAPNRWPDLPEFRHAMLTYFDACHRLGVALHQAFSADLGLDTNHFAPHFTAPLATLRLLHYPPARGTEGEIGAGAHTDYGSVTLLMTDGEAGLQVQPRGGDWVDVPHVPGAFTVNIGDCLMRWTNDIYRSTPHRVLPPKRQRRSVAFFLDPNPEAPIEALPGTGPAKYPPTTGARYLRSRLDATYAGTT